MSSEVPGEPSRSGKALVNEKGMPKEVRAYLKNLLALIGIGIVLMAVTAIWAWNTYAGKLADRPALPSGTPPMSSVPATTR